MAEADIAQALRNQVEEKQRLVDTLEAQLDRKDAELQIVRQISAEVNATLALDQTLEVVLQAMDTVLGFRHCMVLLAEDGADRLRLAASRGYHRAALGIEVPIGQGVVGVVARRRRMMRIANLRSQIGYLASVRQHAEADGATGFGAAATLPGLPDAQSQIAIPLVVKDRLVGVFLVESATANAFGELDETLLSIVANQVANAIDMARLHRSAVERSAALDRANAELSQLNATLETQVEKRTGALEEALTEVRREQARSAALLHRMAPPAVIPLMLEDKLVARRLEATVLFTDLEDFTGFTTGMEPDEVFALLNDLFSWAGEIVQRYRGYVNKIAGDGMMAVFGVPFGSSTHRSDAVLAALAMQQELAGRFPLSMRIGINTGPITAGLLGPADKSLYDVLGQTANLASRMEAACPVGSIALPAKTGESLAPWFALASLGEVDVRGIGPTSCLAANGLRPLCDDTRRIHPASRFAAAHLRCVAEVEQVAAERLAMVDFASIQARDTAFGHNQAVAAFALALTRSQVEAGAPALPPEAEADLVLAALLHDVGKHAVDTERLNRQALSADDQERLRRELRDSPVLALAQLDLARLEPLVCGLYDFEACRGASGNFDPAVEILAAADIYDALTAPKLYRGTPWRIVGALEELLRLPWCSGAERPVFSAFVALMKPADAKVAARSRSQVLLR